MGTPWGHSAQFSTWTCGGLHCLLTAVLCWQELALSGMDGDTERAVSLGTVWPSRAMGQLCSPRLYLARLCTGVVFLAVPDRAVYRCCVPGCAYWHRVPSAMCVQVLFAWLYLPGLGVQAPCSGCLSQCHCGLWHTWSIRGAAPGRVWRGDTFPCHFPLDVVLELLPAVAHKSASTSPELPWLFCPEEPSQSGEIPANCGGAASHQDCPGSAIVTQHRCDVVLCLSGPAVLILLPQGGRSPGAAEVPSQLLLIPRTVFGKTVGSRPGSLRMRSLHDPSMTLQGSDTAIMDASVVCRVPRCQYFL